MTGDHGDDRLAMESAVHHDWDGYVEVSTAVVRAVAVALDRPELELPPLGSAVDPDALNRLVNRDDDDGPLGVSFTYEGVTVRVASDGAIAVWPATDSAE